MTNINIIGAGPIGNYIAYLLSKKDYDVKVFEEHSKIGLPVQCTGIVTSAIKELIKLKKEFVLNKIDKIAVIAPNNTIEFDLKEKEFILDRKRFDEYLYDKAINSGAKFFLKHKFLDYKKEHILVKDLKNKKIRKIKTNILIGADGPLSSVAKSSNLFYNRRFLVGIQARVKIKNNPSIYKTFFGKNFPGFFGWFVPESEKIVRVGLATKKNTKHYFEKFIRQFNGKIVEKQAGFIPVYNKKIKTQGDNIYLVGDAACQIKNTTGGGIIPGLICSKVLVNCIINKRDYEKKWRKKIGRELYLHLKLRDCLNRFSDEDYNFLIQLLKKEKTKDILEKYNREFPSQFLLRLLLKEPRFLYFLKNVF